MISCDCCDGDVLFCMLHVYHYFYFVFYFSCFRRSMFYFETWFIVFKGNRWTIRRSFLCFSRSVDIIFNDIITTIICYQFTFIKINEIFFPNMEVLDKDVQYKDILSTNCKIRKHLWFSIHLRKKLCEKDGQHFSTTFRFWYLIVGTIWY